MKQIEEIFEQYSSVIFNAAYKLSGKREVAEDITQQTFIQAWKHWDELKDEGAVKAWLYAICVNEFKMIYRKKARQNEIYTDKLEALEKEAKWLSEKPVSALDEVQAGEDVTEMRNGCFLAMARKLTLQQRIAFALIDMFGLTIQEAAEILDVTPKAVKGLLYRARMNLDSFFQGHCYFLNADNPCRCKAWMDFFSGRGQMQSMMREELLDYKKRGYTFDWKVRRKVADYFAMIPEEAPSKDWYQSVIAQIQNG